MIGRSGNARKKQTDDSPGPWLAWEETDLAERAIRFLETYCRPPTGFGYGQPMRLADFQKDWIRKVLAPGIRSAAMQCPRGQGKSTLLAGLAVWATFDRCESGEPSVPIMATTVGQAMRSVYDVAVKMIQKEPELETRCIIYTGIGTARIVVGWNGGECFPIANHVDGLQGLNFSFAVVDEIGFQPLESWNSLLLAQGKRSQSLIVGIGTPGYGPEAALWTLRVAYLEGRTPPGFSFTEYSAPDGCDHRDEANWFLANPALAAGYQDIDALRTSLGMVQEAIFRMFHLGQWVDGTDAWLGVDGRKVWDGLHDPYKLVPGARTWVGVDVGLKHDSTAVVLGQRRPDGRLHTEARIWWPTDSQVIDVHDIMQHLREVDDTYDVAEVAYDPRHFEVAAVMLADEGLPMVEMPQSTERMTPAFGHLYESILRKEISHNGDRDYAAQVLNGVCRFNERGFTLGKGKSRGKIDAAYALAMMYDRAQHPVKPASPLFIGWAA